MIWPMPWPLEYCYDCDNLTEVCLDCGCCSKCCSCQLEMFDADELGIDPEVDAERYENA